MLEVMPIGNKILIKLVPETESKSGLKLVRNKKEWQEETVVAEVIVLGRESDLDFELKEGTHIIIAGHAGKWIDPGLTPDGNFIYRIIEQDEVIAYLQEVPDAGESSPDES